MIKERVPVENLRPGIVRVFTQKRDRMFDQFLRKFIAATIAGPFDRPLVLIHVRFTALARGNMLVELCAKVFWQRPVHIVAQELVDLLAIRC